MLSPLVLLLIPVGIAIAMIIAFVRARQYKKSHKKELAKYDLFANTEQVQELPEYHKAKRKYQALVAVASCMMIIGVIATGVLISRPVSVSTAKPQYDRRDIMLCLDISGSMDQYVKDLLGYFSELVDYFEGQRVGITIFNGVYLQIFPLTDDYESLSYMLQDLKGNSSDYGYALYVNGYVSQIGPGLVGCIQSFDKLEEENRSRAIILSTDNYAGDGQEISLAQAANYAKQYDIAIYGLNTSDYRSQEEIDNKDDQDDDNTLSFSSLSTQEEFRKSILSTGGSYYAFSQYSTRNDVSVKRIVDQILAQAAARYEGAETLVTKDTPLVPTIIVAISILVFVAAVWRLGL